MASCDINDVQNVGELSTSTFPVSKEDGEAVLAGVYQNLNQVCADPQMSFLYYAQLASDDMLGGGGVNDKLTQADDLLCNYNADMTNIFYEARYKGINRANTLIEALPNTSMNEDTKNSLMGQAKFCVPSIIMSWLLCTEMCQCACIQVLRLSPKVILKTLGSRF